MEDLLQLNTLADNGKTVQTFADFDLAANHGSAIWVYIATYLHARSIAVALSNCSRISRAQIVETIWILGYIE